jgi:hypothetical protein
VFWSKRASITFAEAIETPGVRTSLPSTEWPQLALVTPEDMLDTSEEDARTEENFKQADRLHEEA